MMESDLKHLPDPSLPEGLAAGIAARIARLDEDSDGRRSADDRRENAPRARDAWWAWAVTLLGVTVGLSAQVYRLIVGEATLDLTSLRLTGGMQGVVEMLPASPAVAVLAVSLILYLAGLFTTVHHADRSR